MPDIGEEHPRDTSEERIKSLRRQRAGKKGLITKRIQQLDELTSQGGSRTRTTSLLQSLIEVKHEAKKINQSLEDLGEDTEDWMDWMDEISLAIDNCKANIEEYLDSRKHEAPSEDGRNWIMNEFHRSEEHTTEVDPFLTSGFSKLTLGNAAKPTEWRSQSLFGPIGSDPTQSSGTKPKSSEERNLFQRSYADTRTKIDTSPFTTELNRHQQVEENQVDSWIDLLDATKPPPLQSQTGKTEDFLAMWLVQQGLPRIRIPWFDVLRPFTSSSLQASENSSTISITYQQHRSASTYINM